MISSPKSAIHCPGVYVVFLEFMPAGIAKGSVNPPDENDYLTMSHAK